jgi:hypothetical protein
MNVTYDSRNRVVRRVSPNGTLKKGSVLHEKGVGQKGVGHS